MKRQIVYAFATIFVLAGVFSASSGPSKKPLQNVMYGAAPAPSCSPNAGCKWPY